MKDVAMRKASSVGLTVWIAVLGVPVLLHAEAPASGTASASMATVQTASIDARLQKLIDTGVAFLQSQQGPTGQFGSDKAPPAITALATRALVSEASLTADSESVKRAYDYLLSQQLEDGGIYKDLLANYNTAIAISALAAAEDGRYKPQIDRAVAYLKRMQWTPDTIPEYAGEKEENQGKQVVKDDKDPFFGGWGYGGRSRGPGRPDLSNVQMAIDALHDAGVSKDDPAMQKAILFLSRTQNLSETNDQPWAGNDGGFVYGPSHDRRGESFAGETTDAAGERRLRSYGSMTYAGLKSFIYAGLSKDDPRVKAAFDWVTKNWSLDENPGMKLAKPENAQHGLYYYYHTLARSLHAYDAPTFATPDGETIDWRVALIDKLEQQQKPDGSWVGDKRWMEDNAVLTTSYVVLALQEARDDLKRSPAK
jgi:squalene-hopene/tetraprenyl-beta-curcumene cyclase